ncbi:MAG TPA: GerMN domain-containing protein, partial [Caldisericia bacterium]|nr:GerMN domain-containing protein [Caldisericia bacterium]
MRKKTVNKKVYKERRIAFLIILIFLIIFLFSLRFFDFNIFNRGTDTAKIYFFDEKSNELIFEKRTIPKYSSTQEKIKRLIDELVSGPESESLKEVVDPQTRVLSVEINKDEAIVSFSKEIKNRVLEGVTGEAASLYSIVNTIIGNTSLRNVTILIEGKKNDLYWSSMPISSSLTFFSSKLPSGKKVNLYFFDKNNEHPIVIEEEISEPKDSVEWAKLIFSKLKAGPNSSLSNKVSKTIPDEAILKDLKIEGDLIYLNFTSDILNYRGFGSSSEYAFMYSTILSITEIPGVKRVLFLIDGKSVETIGG